MVSLLIGCNKELLANSGAESREGGTLGEESRRGRGLDGVLREQTPREQMDQSGAEKGIELAMWRVLGKTVS